MISDRPSLEEILVDVLGRQVMPNGKSKLYKQERIKKVVNIWATLNKRGRITVTFGVGLGEWLRNG